MASLLTSDMSKTVSYPLTLEFPSSLPRYFLEDSGACPSNIVVMDFTLSSMESLEGILILWLGSALEIC
jgi:hypothetical protein